MRFGDPPPHATRQSWQHTPFPEQCVPLSVARIYTEQEYERIRHGVTPEAMEDKWFIFLEDTTLYFYRSWTGLAVYKLTFAREGATYKVSRAFAARDPSQPSEASDSYDARLIVSLIDNLLLGQAGPLPLPAGLSAGIATELHHSSVIGAGRSKDEPPKITIRAWLWHWLKWLIRGLWEECVKYVRGLWKSS